MNKNLKGYKMTRTNRQQKMMARKLQRAWQPFRDAGQEKQTELTDHTFSFHIDEIGAGWEYVHFILDDDGFGFRISYIGPGVTDFVKSMTTLKKESKEFTWYDEPDEYTWFVSRLKDIVYVEPPISVNGFYLKYLYFRNQILEGYKNSLYGIE